MIVTFAVLEQVQELAQEDELSPLVDEAFKLEEDLGGSVLGTRMAT